ncbi:MAG: hypothetical protein IKN87_00105 [Bacilli bacterium]|nr:hypothetical protein [Bacilli bacterium]
MEEENKNEEVVASDVNKPIEEVNTSNQPTEDTVTTNEPVVEAAPIVEQPIKRSKKDIIGYNPETGEPIYKEIVPGSEAPKKSKKGLIIGLIIAVIVIIAGVVIAILCLGGKKDDEEQEKELTNREYRQIVADYGKSAEKAIEKYMDKEDEIPSFKDIKDDIKYDDYKVSCNTFKINYDGTVYIAACTVDGKEIKKTISYGEEKEEPKTNDTENYVYFYKENDEIKVSNKKDDIKDEKSIVSKYECPKNNICNLVQNENFMTKIMDNNKAFIIEYEGKPVKAVKIVLFDIVNNKVVGTYGTKANWLYKNDSKISDDGEYVLIQKLNSDAFIIIDKDGKVIKDNFYPTGANVTGVGGYVLSKNKYSIENDYIVSLKDNKEGITRITSDDIVIDYKYDNICFIDNTYFKTLENDKWFLFSFDTKGKVLSDGFDYIFGIYNNVLVVYNDRKIYIKDLTGNDLIDTPIDGLDNPNIHESIYGPVARLDGNTIIIKVVNWNTETTSLDEVTTYKYNIATKTLEKE